MTVHILYHAGIAGKYGPTQEEVEPPRDESERVTITTRNIQECPETASSDRLSVPRVETMLKSQNMEVVVPIGRGEFQLGDKLKVSVGQMGKLIRGWEAPLLFDLMTLHQSAAVVVLDLVLMEEDVLQQGW